MVKKLSVKKKSKPAVKSKNSAKGGSVKKSPAEKPAKIKQPKPIGKISHFYSGLDVAIIKFNKDVKKGVNLRFKGHTTDFEQAIKSMQYDHKDIAVAKKGKEVGIKVRDKVREGDEVYEIK
ncbi:MAG: translation elongation factor-like protein [Candidatus Brennerbacteria bacterium]|nr:translation elongation factor-like protein [Candidatus Brennerbacteria bacterium]